MIRRSSTNNTATVAARSNNMMSTDSREDLSSGTHRRHGFSFNQKNGRDLIEERCKCNQLHVTCYSCMQAMAKMLTLLRVHVLAMTP